MTENANAGTKRRGSRSKASVAIVASLFVFCLIAVALWALTTLGLVYALATAAPVTIVVACGIVVIEPVAEVFAAVVEVITAIFVAIAEMVGAVVAGILAALAAVFGIFGG